MTGSCKKRDIMYYSGPTSHPRRDLFTAVASAFCLLFVGVFFFTQQLSLFALPSLSVRSYQRVTFKHNAALHDLSPAGDNNWSALLPSNGGFVMQQQADGRHEMAGLSIFHQLQCLSMLRSQIQSLTLERDLAIGDGETGSLKKSAELRSRHDSDEDSQHWVHCLDYLAQVS